MTSEVISAVLLGLIMGSGCMIPCIAIHLALENIFPNKFKEMSDEVMSNMLFGSIVAAICCSIFFAVIMYMRGH